MPRACTVCTSADRADIDKALIAGEAFRHIANRYGTSTGALQRHKAEHLPLVVAEAERRVEAERTDTATAIVRERTERTDTHILSVMGQLERCYERMHLLFDACDGWLRDADDPSRYDIGPRGEEITVTYTLVDGDGNVVREKGKLGALLAEVRKAKGATSASAETKYADPRELVIRTAYQITEQTKLLASVIEKVYNAREVEAFQRAVLEAIGDAAPDVRASIERSLRRRQPLRGPLPGGDRRGVGPGAGEPDA